MGITGKDFTLIAASKAAMRGATILKASDDKTRQLNKHTLMAYSGEAGDTGISDSRSLIAHAVWLTILYSAIRRVSAGQRSALLDAQRDRPVTISTGTLRSWRACIEPPITETIQRQPPPGRSRPHHTQAQPVLVGLPCVTGGSTLRCPRLCAVCLGPHPYGLVRP